MKTAEDVLKNYETHVKHSYVPIYLEENVLKAMEEYSSEKDKEIERLKKENDQLNFFIEAQSAQISELQHKINLLKR